MGICCGKTHPEIIKVDGKKEVATSTSSLKDNFQDVKNVFSEKESDDTEISPVPSIDTKIVTDQEDLFDTVAARTHYSTFQHDKNYDSVRRPSVYVKGRRISLDEDQIRLNNLTGQRLKSEGVTSTRTGKYFPKRPSLPEGQALLDYEECFKGFNADDFEKEASYFVNAILEKEKPLSLGVNQEQEEEEGKSCNVQNSGNAICNNVKERRLSQAQDHTSDNLTEQRRKSEEVISTRTGKHFPKRPSLPEGQALLDYKEWSWFKDFNADEKVEERDEGVDEKTCASQDESDTESFFDVKGEMLSLFNKLEADASFLHTIKLDQDLKSTTSEERSSNGDYSLVHEMETIFQELKQQADENEANSSHSNSDKKSEVESIFDMSNEIENIISKFDKCSVSSKSSEIQKISEEESSLISTPGKSPDSSSFFHIQGELESRLQNLVLHLDGSGSDEESQGRKDEISAEEGPSSGDGSYFNMQDEIELRLDLIKHGNFI